MAAWATVPQDRFDALWLLAGSAAPFLVSVLVGAGPFAHQNPETWIWDAVTNKHLIVSRVEISLSRKP